MKITNRVIKRAIKEMEKGNFDLDHEVMEVIKTFNKGKIKKKVINLSSVKDTVDYARSLIKDSSRENFSIFFLTASNEFIETETLFIGTIDKSSIYIREIIKKVFEYNAKSVIFVHNHPSGNPKPSQADIEMTKKAKEALEIVSTRMLDHIIISKESDRYYSFLEEGII